MNKINLADYAAIARAQGDIGNQRDAFCPACQTSYMSGFQTVTKNGRKTTVHVYENRPMSKCLVCQGNGELAMTLWSAVGESLNGITDAYLATKHKPDALPRYVEELKEHARTWSQERYEVRARLRKLREIDPTIDISVDAASVTGCRP